MEKMKCSRCGSDKMMSDLRIHDIGKRRMDWIGIEIVARPGNLVFKESHKEFMRANVCGECGNVEFTVDNPKGLWETYTKRNNT